MQGQIEKIENGDILMVEPNDKEIAEAFRRRQEKYRYFLKQMEIDARYDNIMGDKVGKLKSENQKKKEVLARKRREEQCKREEE